MSTETLAGTAYTADDSRKLCAGTYAQVWSRGQNRDGIHMHIMTTGRFEGGTFTGQHITLPSREAITELRDACEAALETDYTENWI